MGLRVRGGYYHIQAVSELTGKQGDVDMESGVRCWHWEIELAALAKLHVGEVTS